MAVEIGAPAPDFTLRDQQNQPVSLADFRGRKNVVLMFYPYTFTRVCHGELCAVRDDLSSFQNEDTQVLAVSTDTVPAQRVWSDQEGFTFPVLSDHWPHGAVAQAYGVFDEKRGCAVRGTFIIDKEGILRWQVVNAIPDARDQDEYLAVLASL